METKTFLSIWIYDRETNETYNIRMRKIIIKDGERIGYTLEDEKLLLESSRYVILEVMIYELRKND